MLKRTGTILMALVLSFSVLPVKVSAESRVEETIDVFDDAFVEASVKDVGAGASINIEPEAGEEAEVLNEDVISGTYDDLSYEIRNGEVMITNCDESAVSVDIPSEIEGYPVTSIDEYAFSSCKSMTSITIPDSVTSIGERAFVTCSSLVNVKIGTGVKVIGEAAFCYCSNLTNITIPDSVTGIGYEAFEYCSSLKSITLSNSLTSISDYTFGGCTSLTGITIPDSVTSICKEAFYNCSSLTNITIPNGATSIGYLAFGDCSSLTSITIPDTVTNISSSAFSGCTGLKTAGPIGEGYDYEFGWKTVIPDNAFAYCSSLTNITIPEGITSIGERAFLRCSALTDINIPSNVKTIGSFAFYGCNGLTSVTLPDSVTELGGGAFCECTGLSKIVLSNSITSLPSADLSGTDDTKGMFENCSNLTNMEIPESVTSIGDLAFHKCTNLVKIIIPESVKTIGSNAFSGCSGFKTAGPIGDGYDYEFGWKKEIPSNAFVGCGGLTHIKIPESVTSIGSFAFAGCKSLTDIKIPDGVTIINDYTFTVCSSLPYINIPDGVTSIGDWAFNSCSSLTDITIPKNVTRIGRDGFHHCSSLKTIEFMGKVKYVGFTRLGSSFGYSFADCPSLEKIYFRDDMPEKISQKTFSSDMSFTAYYPANNTTWEYVKENNPTYGAGSITWKTLDEEFEDESDRYSPETGFSVKRDGWCFRNKNDGFGYEKDYLIPTERYVEVFGKDFVSAILMADKSILNICRNWGGNCAGMSTAAILFYLGKLNWDDYDALYEEDFPTVNSYYDALFGSDDSGPNTFGPKIYARTSPDQEITKMIERYQISQDAFFLEDSSSGLLNHYWIEQKDNNGKYVHNPSGDYITQVIEMIENSRDPLMLTINGKDFSHTIVLRTDKAPFKEENGWIKYYVYDPNNPYLSPDYYEKYSKVPEDYYCNWLAEDRYIELNPELNLWRYVSSKGKNSKGRVLGYTDEIDYYDESKVPYKEYPTNETGIKEYRPEFFIVSNIAIPATPLKFDGTLPWRTAGEHIGEQTINRIIKLFSSLMTTAIVTDDQGEMVLTIDEGTVTAINSDYVNEIVTLPSAMEDSEDSTYDHILLKNANYHIQLSGGSDILMTDNDSSISISTDNDLTLNSNEGISTVSFASDDTSRFRFKLQEAESNSVFDSVSGIGELDKNDQFGVTLKDKELNIDNGISEDGKVQIYVSNEEKDEDEYVRTLKDGDDDLIISDVTDEAEYSEYIDLSISLDKSELSLAVGKTDTLTAAVMPEESKIVWSSSDPSVATVDQNGKVTAVADTGIGTPAQAEITATANGSVSAKCIVTVEDPINGFVRRLYKLCFNRTADPGGFRQWTNGLRTKKNTAAATVRFFFTSQEFKNLKLNDDAFVEMCYQVMMDRASDAGGKKNWVSKLDIGMSQTYVLRGFIASREFSKICADYGITVGSISLTEPRDQNQGITEFVSRCYSEVLGRKADTGGLNDWCNRILTASSRKQAAINAASNGFFHSAEYLNKHTTNDQYVRTLYRTFLGREADQGGYNDWMNKLRTGTSRDSVMKGFANSTEFANIMAKYGIK